MPPSRFSKEYIDHLNSPYWKGICKQASARAHGLCERCRKRPARDTHHRHYNTFGHERLEDVLAVCRECHDILEVEKKAEREERNWNSRVEGWAAKKYGRGWEGYRDPCEVEREFEAWLERKGEY